MTGAFPYVYFEAGDYRVVCLGEGDYRAELRSGTDLLGVPQWKLSEGPAQLLTDAYEAGIEHGIRTGVTSASLTVGSLDRSGAEPDYEKIRAALDALLEDDDGGDS